MMMNNFDFSTLLVRCSSLGLIMTDPRGKSMKQKYDELAVKRDDLISKINEGLRKENGISKTVENLSLRLEKIFVQMEEIEPLKDQPLLSETCKSHLMDIYVSTKYGRESDIVSKYLDKGRILEDDAITLYSRATETIFEKNLIIKSNDFIKGQIDFDGDDDIIRDTKVSWDIYTFYRNLVKPLDSIYYWQMQGYMWLLDRRKAKVIFTLLDTPKQIIESEKKKLLYEFIGSQEEYEAACADMEHRMIYEDIALEERIIEIEVERNDEDIAKIPERVKQCRDFLNNIEQYKIKTFKETV